jgi:hypothetical protein
MSYTIDALLSFIYTLPYNITMTLRRDHGVNVMTLRRPSTERGCTLVHASAAHEATS